MAAAAADMIQLWAGHLADVTEHVTKELPGSEEWNSVRHFLSNISRLLRKGDAKSGFKAVVKMLPYIQGAISHVEKCNGIKASFDLTEAISEHFLVDECHKEHINNLLRDLEGKLSEIRAMVTKLAKQLDETLDDVIEYGESLSWWRGLRFAFEINRISALTKTCEAQLKYVRDLIDELDSHVAGKSFIAHAFMYLSFLLGVAFSASGNVPVGAACMSAATATRSAAKSLVDYRKALTEVDRKHTALQNELRDWKHKFAAEQKNFLYLFGTTKTLFLIGILILISTLIGQTGNTIVFCLLIGLSLMQSYVTESNRYNAALAVACCAVWAEYKYMYGFLLYNNIVCVMLFVTSVGYFD